MIIRAIGLMSGTSMDGVDVALIETDGEAFVRRGPFSAFPYADADRAVLRQALADATALEDRLARPGALAEAQALVTQRHGEAVEAFCAAHAVDAATIDVIGFHGQTVLHRPERRLTVQIGDGAALARRIGRPVVFDLRAADVAAGGQGAPLVPIYHRALAAAARLPSPTAVVNIGGVANVTWIADGDAAPIACDTGPGNALIDDLMLERTGVAIDRDGACAAAGRVDEAALARLLAHPFFALKPPKSLDRNAFSRASVAHLSTADAAATLTAFTARSIAGALAQLGARPGAVIVCGGGARNPTLMAMLRASVGMADAAETVGWSADAMEAEAFAYLAARSLRGLPITFPTTTGAPAPMTGGVRVDP